MKKKENRFFIVSFMILIVIFIVSLTVGQYPLSLSDIISGDETARKVFLTLRLPRTVMALLAGFGLSLAGYVYQVLFKNPIASPEIIGVSSGACVGSGIAIVFLGGGTFSTAILAFLGGITAVALTSIMASVSKEQKIATLVLSGIAVNALSESVLMLIKLSADPERQLASLEYWTMGSLASITADKVVVIAPFIILSTFILFKLYRQISILSLDTEEAKMLGVNVKKMRIAIMIIATIVVGAIVSVTGLISFVGLIAPHLARLLLKQNNKNTMLLSGIFGGILLLLSDCLARSITLSELPVSVITSIIGVPFLIALIVKGEKIK